MTYRVVYFIRAETLGLVKIGCASDARRRLMELRVGSPDKLKLLGVIYADDAYALEQDIHSRFARQRSHGEWFKPNRKLAAEIRRAQDPDDPFPIIVLTRAERDVSPDTITFMAEPGEDLAAFKARTFPQLRAMGIAA